MRLTSSLALTVVVFGLAATYSLTAQGTGTKESPIRITRDMPPLKRVKVVAPAYPADAQRGTTILELTVAPTGNVDRVDLIVSVKGANDAAIAAAKQWVYEPLMRDGQAVWTVTVLSVPNPWSETSR